MEAVVQELKDLKPQTAFLIKVCYYVPIFLNNCLHIGTCRNAGECAAKKPPVRGSAYMIYFF